MEVCCPPNRIIVEEGTGGSTGGGSEVATGGGTGITDGGVGGETGGDVDRGPEGEGNVDGGNQLGVVDDKRCGHRNPDGIGFCIVNEQNGEAEYGEFPWMVALASKKNNLFVYLCGGSLINLGVVLTAAHCVPK